MDLKRITGKAKDLVEKRGGSDSLKQDAEELKGIAKGQGSLADKAKAAVSAIKDPGTDESGATTARPAPADSPASEATAAEAERADEKVKGEQRGKHAQGGHRGQGPRGRRRHGRGEGRRGRDDDPAV